MILSVELPSLRGGQRRSWWSRSPCHSIQVGVQSSNQESGTWRNFPRISRRERLHRCTQTNIFSWGNSSTRQFQSWTTKKSWTSSRIEIGTEFYLAFSALRLLCSGTKIYRCFLIDNTNYWCICFCRNHYSLKNINVKRLLTFLCKKDSRWPYAPSKPWSVGASSRCNILLSKRISGDT